MLSLFRSNQLSNGLLLLPYALLLQLPAFFATIDFPTTTAGPGYLADNFPMLFGISGSPWGTVITAFWVAATGVIANIFIARTRASRTVSQLPGLGVVLLWGLLPAAAAGHPAVAASFFLAAAAWALTRSYKNPKPETTLFAAGCWAGIAFLIDPSFLAFLPFLLLTVGIFRAATLLNLIQLLIGFLSLVFLAFSVAYFFEEADVLLLAQLRGFTTAKELTAYWDYGWVAHLAISLLTIWGLLAMGSSRAYLGMDGKKSLGLIAWLLLATPLVAYFNTDIGPADVIVLFLPAGILVGLGFYAVSRERGEVIHLFLLATVLVLRYLYFIGG